MKFEPEFWEFFFEKQIIELAIVVNKHNSNVVLINSILKELKKQTKNLNFNLIDEDCYPINSINDAPLLLQTLSETFQYDALIYVDAIDKNDTFSVNHFFNVNQAIFNVEIENGTKIERFILDSSINANDHSLIQQTVNEMLLNLINQVNVIIKIRYESNTDEINEEMKKS